MLAGERRPGSSPRVVLLHGLGADHRAFQRFSRLLPEAWDLTLLDLLGHGDAPHPERGYSLEDHADYVAECIADLVGATWLAQELSPEDQVVLVGHSYGAATSVACAARHPNLVRGIVLLDAIVKVDERLDAPANAASSAMHPDRVEPDSWKARSLDPSGRGENATQQMCRARRENTLPETVGRLFAHESGALRKWIIDTWQQMAVGVVDELDNDWPRFAPRVTCPVAVVHGDAEVGGGGPAPAMLFDHAAVTRIEGAGHYLHATHARETAAAVIADVDAIVAQTGAPA